MKSFYLPRLGLAMAFFALSVVSHWAFSQPLPAVTGVEPQPLLAQVMRLEEALTFIGSALPEEDVARLRALRGRLPDPDVVQEVQAILDPYCLAMVRINPEARVSVERGPAAAGLIQNGWRTFLVKVHNEAGVRSNLEVESPNSQPLFHRSTGASRVDPERLISQGELANRFLEVLMYRRKPLLEHLSGLALEYAVVQIYTREKGMKEARLGFHVGQGTQDVGFRNAVDILFECKPAVRVVFRVRDEDGAPIMASFVVSDGVERLIEDPEHEAYPSDYRHRMARLRNWERGPPRASPVPPAGRLVGIYPLPARRLAKVDEFPDFFFHPQVYRTDGEHVYLPPGEYEVTAGRGPEYLSETRRISVPEGMDSMEVEFTLKRWVHMAKLGWFSGDHHVHAAGCSHYENPEEGVRPEHMWRQVLGEDLNVASVLNWGPGWYHQKQFFRGKTDPLSTDRNLIRYDVEVSGFPSSHAGHIVLLRLQEDDYPGTTRIEQWPSWTLPVLKWARNQGGVAGYAHSGWGLEPMEPVRELPNYVMAKFDSIGANEYIVTVTHDAVDFISAGDTPPHWELNVWYHTLNAGFRTRISGETDFPCIFDDQVGMARTYARLEGSLDYDGFVEAIGLGRSYVSDGRSHIVDFEVGGARPGENGSEARLDAPQNVKISARAIAFLPEEQDEVGAVIAARAPELPPYWHIERARLGKSRKVPVELVVNGEAVGRVEMAADGTWQEVSFEHRFDRSSWVALRVFPSSHTNPVFVLVGDRPVRASSRSAEWCLKAVDQCWRMKEPQIREEERAEAAAAYQHARRVYERILREASTPD